MTLLGQSPTAVKGRIASSYNQAWNLGFQRQFGRSVLAGAIYVGSRGVRLAVNNFNLNQLDPVHQKLGNTALAQLVTNPFAGVITDPLSPLSRPTVMRSAPLHPSPSTKRSSTQDPSPTLAPLPASRSSSIRLTEKLGFEFRAEALKIDGKKMEPSLHHGVWGCV